MGSGPAQVLVPRPARDALPSPGRACRPTQAPRLLLHFLGWAPFQTRDTPGFSLCSYRYQQSLWSVLPQPGASAGPQNLPWGAAHLSSPRTTGAHAKLGPRHSSHGGSGEWGMAAEIAGGGQLWKETMQCASGTQPARWHPPGGSRQRGWQPSRAPGGPPPALHAAHVFDGGPDMGVSPLVPPPNPVH